MRRKLASLTRRTVTNPTLRQALQVIETSYELLRNTASTAIPALIVPSPRMLTVAITAKCNLRCLGCHYGRDYMPGHQLPTETCLRLIGDAAAAGMSTVRLYGGEPLLHPGLDKMIEHSVACGITPFVSTNGQLLGRRLDGMFAAGLRIIQFGYYGHGAVYDLYVGRRGASRQFESSVAKARDKYGDALALHISYVLNTRTCSVEQLRQAWDFAKRYNLIFHIDLVHYSLPYFSEGPDRELQFTPSDAPRLLEFSAELARLKQERPDLYHESDRSIRSIPDWLLKGPAMRIPCDAYDMIWVGADGSVRLCFVTFPLGNLHEKPLSALLFTVEHRKASLGAVQLACPNCHCKRDSRITKHLPSLVRYSLGQPPVTLPPAASKPLNVPFPIIQTTVAAPSDE